MIVILSMFSLWKEDEFLALKFCQDRNSAPDSKRQSFKDWNEGLYSTGNKHFRFFDFFVIVVDARWCKLQRTGLKDEISEPVVSCGPWPHHQCIKIKGSRCVQVPPRWRLSTWDVGQPGWESFAEQSCWTMQEAAFWGSEMSTIGMWPGYLVWLVTVQVKPAKTFAIGSAFKGFGLQNKSQLWRLHGRPCESVWRKIRIMCGGLNLKDFWNLSLKFIQMGGYGKIMQDPFLDPLFRYFLRSNIGGDTWKIWDSWRQLLAEMKCFDGGSSWLFCWQFCKNLILTELFPHTPVVSQNKESSCRNLLMTTTRRHKKCSLPAISMILQPFIPVSYLVAICGKLLDCSGTFRECKRWHF